MKEVNTVEDCTIYQKRSGRYAVKNKAKKYLNGDEKIEILAKAGLVEKPAPKAIENEEPAEEPVAEAETEESAPE